MHILLFHAGADNIWVSFVGDYEFSEGCTPARVMNAATRIDLQRLGEDSDANVGRFELLRVGCV